MKISVFSTKASGRDHLADANSAHGHDLTFFESRLTSDTAGLAAGFDGVCAFVNDDLSADVVGTLAADGVRFIALRSAGFNHVDHTAAREHGITVALSASAMSISTISLPAPTSSRCTARSRPRPTTSSTSVPWRG